MTRHLPTIKRKKIIEDESKEYQRAGFDYSPIHAQSISSQLKKKGIRHKIVSGTQIHIHKEDIHKLKVAEAAFADLHPQQGNWTKIPVSMLQHAEHEPPVNIDTELYNLLAKSYSYVGGHVDFKKPSDIPANHTIWYGLDVDGDKKPEAVKFAKDTLFGRKWTGSATDGSRAAKDALISDTVRLLQTPGNFCEMSDALAHIMMTRYNITCVDNQKDVEKIIGKSVKWIGKHPDGKYPDYNGFYSRELGGASHIKILLGEPYKVHYEAFMKKLNTPTKEDIDTAGVPDAVPDFDMAETDQVVPDIGIDDRLYTEDGGDDENKKTVPSDVVSSGRLYTM